MPISTTIYSVLIDNDNSNSSPDDGFIDNMRIEDYGISLKTVPPGLDYNLCKAKRRGNMRYREIVNQMNIVSNCRILDNDAFINDSSITDEGTEIGFQVIVEHGESSLVTNDELNPGDFLTGTDCLVRCIARAMIAEFTLTIDVVDPTAAVSTPITSPDPSTSVPRYGNRIISLEVGPYAADIAEAEAMITLTDITPY